MDISQHLDKVFWPCLAETTGQWHQQQREVRFAWSVPTTNNIAKCIEYMSELYKTVIVYSIISLGSINMMKYFILKKNPKLKHKLRLNNHQLIFSDWRVWHFTDKSQLFVVTLVCLGGQMWDLLVFYSAEYNFKGMWFSHDVLQSWKNK